MLHFPDEILVPVCMLFEKSLRVGRDGFLRNGGRQMLCQFTRLETGGGLGTIGQYA